MGAALLLLLADGRFPGGGHAHSGGLEAAVAAKRVTNADELENFLVGRLTTQGRTDAALAAAALSSHRVLALDAEATARCPSAAMRAASRVQGRGLVRAARVAFPSVHLDELHRALPGGAMWPVALGAVCDAAGLEAASAALLAASGIVTTPAWAATRLLGLDPFVVAALLGKMGPEVDRVAAAGAAVAAAWQRNDGPSLPAAAAVQLELDAEVHATWEVRLFAS